LLKETMSFNEEFVGGGGVGRVSGNGIVGKQCEVYCALGRYQTLAG
jgi:hypothetical protein